MFYENRFTSIPRLDSDKEMEPRSLASKDQNEFGESVELGEPPNEPTQLRRSKRTRLKNLLV